MALKTPSIQISYQPLDIVGSSTFGKSPDIMASRTFNMFQTDDWMTNYPGHSEAINISNEGTGRGIFTSGNSGVMICVINEFAYVISLFSLGIDGKKNFSYRKIGELATITGDVFIDENNANQIAICDQLNLYIWNSITDTFQIALMPTTPSGSAMVPGYVTFQNGNFVVPDTLTNFWALSAPNDGLNWFWGASGQPVQGTISTKPDLGRVTIRFPGHGNLLLVLGKTVGELFTDIGGALFPYQRSTSVNFDYGCVNPATLASSEDFVAWLGSNERSEPVIMFCSGSDIKTLSTDGINNLLQKITNPEKSVGFFVKIMGHLIYQLTFFDPKDNFTLMYDFTTNKFYDATDENMDHHIARKVAFFQDEYYFISLNDGNIYLMSSDLNSLSYGNIASQNLRVYDMPRVRVCSNFRLPDCSRFIVSNIALTIEQGNDNLNTIANPDYVPRMALSISNNGGITFSSYENIELNKSGNGVNIMQWWNLGASNNFVAQFRFWSKGPSNLFNGVMGFYQ